MDNSLRKPLYKIELWLIKAIPIIISILYFTNTILSYFNINLEIFSMLGGLSLITILFLYISSFVFNFCKYHRLFIHYITLNWLLDVFDYYIGIPITNKAYLILILSITAIFIYFITYFKLKKI